MAQQRRAGQATRRSAAVLFFQLGSRDSFGYLPRLNAGALAVGRREASPGRFELRRRCGAGRGRRVVGGCGRRVVRGGIHGC